MEDEKPKPYEHPKPLYEYEGKKEIPDTPPPPPPIQETTPEPPKPLKKLGKWNASVMLIKQSFRLLNKDREIMLFPILSSVAMLVIIGFTVLISIFVFGFNFQETVVAVENEETLSSSWYAYMFIMYVISMFVTTYFQAGLVTIVHARINGQDKSFQDGINNANAHIGKIFTWSLLSATVGVVLQFLSDRSKWLGKLAVTLLGAAWNIVTLFIVPVLILDNLSLKDSVKKSGNVFKKMWGETLIINFSTGLIFGLIMVITSVVLVTLGAISGLLIPFIILTIILVIFIALLSGTLSSVFKVVLYHFATTGTIVDGFDRDLVMGAVKSKS